MKQSSGNVQTAHVQCILNTEASWENIVTDLNNQPGVARPHHQSYPAVARLRGLRGAGQILPRVQSTA